MRENLYTHLMKKITLCSLAIVIIYPLIKMMMQIQGRDISVLLRSNEFQNAVMNSIKVTGAASVISLTLAYVLAYAISERPIRFKKAFALIITLPMLLPSISHGLSLINVFGENGFLNKWFHININLYGFKGIVMGFVIYTLPVAFLLLLDGMRYIDKSKYEVAMVLGIPKKYQGLVVTWPYMKKTIIVTFFAIATMIFTDYGVPLAVGGRFSTLATFLYTEVIGLLNFSKGAIIGCILLIPSIINFILDISIRDIRGTHGEQCKEIHKPHKISDYLLEGLCILISGFIIVLIASFSMMAVVKKYPYDMTFSIEHIENVLKKGGITYLLNAIWISSIVAVVGTLLAYSTAYITTRLKQDWCTKLIHMIAISSIAIPGIVLGLSYMMSFKGSFIYKTFFVLVLVNIVHFFTSPYLMACNTMQKLNVHYEEIGKTLRINRLRLIRDVFIPNTIDTILEMFTYFFINAMTTISAVTFLYSIKNMPISIMINQFIGSLMFEEAAIVSLMILITNLVMKLGVWTIKRR